MCHNILRMAAFQLFPVTEAPEHADRVHSGIQPSFHICIRIAQIQTLFLFYTQFPADGERPVWSRFFRRSCLLAAQQLLSRFVTDRAGEIYVSKRDLERMPDDFPAKIEKAAQEKGGSLVLKKEPREIDGGFVLVYGGVEENCSAGALFASQRDELADKVHAMLFG